MRGSASSENSVIGAVLAAVLVLSLIALAIKRLMAIAHWHPVVRLHPARSRFILPATATMGY
jgi:hypothetical protein